MIEGSNFQEAVVYALCCIHRDNLVLKCEQKEVWFCLYRGQDVFARLSTAYYKSYAYICSLFYVQLQVWLNKFSTE